jgi:hypothetical protein
MACRCAAAKRQRRGGLCDRESRDACKEAFERWCRGNEVVCEGGRVGAL